VQALAELLVAAIEDVVEQDAVALGGRGRAQNENIDLVAHHAAGIARGLVEIDDNGVVWRLGIKLTPCHTPDPHIGAGLAEGLALRERRDGIDPDLGDAGLSRPGGDERRQRNCKRLR